MISSFHISDTVEAKLVSAEHSKALDDTDSSSAIDKNFASFSKIGQSADQTTWLKVELDRIHCVQQVIEYKADRSIQYKWKCSGDRCSDCTGPNCNYFVLTVSTKDPPAQTLSSKPECKYGDVVKQEKIAEKDTLTVNEMVVIAGLSLPPFQNDLYLA